MYFVVIDVAIAKYGYNAKDPREISLKVREKMLKMFLILHSYLDILCSFCCASFASIVFRFFIKKHSRVSIINKDGDWWKGMNEDGQVSWKSEWCFSQYFFFLKHYRWYIFFIGWIFSFKFHSININLTYNEITYES